MASRLEFPIFLALALAAHLALWPRGEAPGAEASGAGGDDRLTLAAGGAELSALVESWEAPIELGDRAAELAEPVEPALAPERPLPAAPRPERAAPPPLPTAAATPEPPAAEAPPSQTAAPEATPRPPARPAPRQPAAAAPRTAEVAAGAGGGADAGNAGPAAASLGTGSSQTLMASWGGQIRAAVERRKRYPQGQRAEGTAQIALTVSGAGELLGASLATSSGNAALDAAALAAVQSARLPRAPAELGPGPHRFTLPISFAR